MNRRAFLTGTTAIAAVGMVNDIGASLPNPYRWEPVHPMDMREGFIAWGKAERGENPKFLAARCASSPWGINGCFSVLGAALVPIVSTSFGLPAVVLVGAAAYLTAIPAFFAVLRPLAAPLGAAAERPVPA